MVVRPSAVQAVSARRGYDMTEKLLINNPKSNNSEVMSNKQRNILQMTKDICRYQPCCNDVCKPISACDALRYAERAVEAGYVKQSEGVWTYGVDREGTMKCTRCRRRMPKIDGARYCPNCGARMRGDKNE